MDVKQPLRVGFAGYGVVGKRRREIIDRRDDMRAAAVSDVTLGGDGKFDDGTRYYADFRRLEQCASSVKADCAMKQHYFSLHQMPDYLVKR